MPRFSFSLRLSLGTAFVALVLLTALALGWSAYALAGGALREGLRTRLHDIVGLGAARIDPAAHARIRGREDEGGEDYRRIKAELRRIRDATTGLRFVYTLRQSADGRVTFVVDSEEGGEDMSHVGDPYDHPTPTMLEAFRPPHAVRVERAFSTDQWGIWLTSYAPIMDAEGRLEAVLAADISAETFARYRRKNLGLMLAVCGAIAAASIAVGMVFSHRLSMPLLGLATDMGRVREFRLDSAPARRSRIREVAVMQDAVESMKGGLRSFKKFVPAELVAELIRMGKEATLGAEQRELTVFFSDIAGFTAISEILPPEALAGRLGVYLEGMAGAVERHGGTVDKFIGDAVMAFWGAPAPCADHAARACAAALGCQRFLERLNAGWRAAGEPEFVTRIGLATGTAVVGNMGHENRLNYTAIGDHVNLAQRLESLNKYYGTRILVSDATWRASGGGFEGRLVDVVAVKGKRRAEPMYELLAEKGSLDPALAGAIRIYDEGFALYLARRWDEARERFAACHAAWPGGDGASGALYNRCLAYAAQPPPVDWDGAHVMHEK
ncbi:MAG: hypothetical protein IT577_24340 [Verrucomicrobiae bacterium]|nr:hypothetical protein [Verrucomicrobiae bacterium]